jgi:hypothetical protein
LQVLGGQAEGFRIDVQKAWCAVSGFDGFEDDGATINGNADPRARGHSQGFESDDRSGPGRSDGHSIAEPRKRYSSLEILPTPRGCQTSGDVK